MYREDRSIYTLKQSSIYALFYWKHCRILHLMTVICYQGKTSGTVKDVSIMTYQKCGKRMKKTASFKWM
jgi:hypothetical protein